MASDPPKPDWDLWAFMIDASAGDTILLSCDVDPNERSEHDLDDGPLRNEVVRRRKILSNLLENSAVPYHNKFVGKQFFKHPVLESFGGWAEKNGWSLPDRFPRPKRTAPKVAAPPPLPPPPPVPVARTAPPPKSALPAGWVSISLPHTTKRLDGFFDVLRKYWTTYDPKALPKQETIAADIDEAIGGTPDRDGTPSRNARALAALMKPEPVAASDKRGRKPRQKD